MKRITWACVIFLLTTTIVFAQGLGSKTTVTLKGRMINISLPDAWRMKDQPKDSPDASKSTVVFIRSNPKAIFDITISDLESDLNYSDAQFQKGFLDQMKGMLQKSVETSGYLWLSDEMSEWFGVPALVVTYVKDNKTRQIIFIKNAKLHIIDFACGKDVFDVQWNDFRDVISTVEFL